MWTPLGCIFRPGYWDYVVAERGTVFCPVYYSQPVMVNYRLRPNYVVATGPNLLANLFVYPRYHHYFFGNYYSSRYLGQSIYPWVSYGQQSRGYDPLYGYYRTQYRDADYINRITRLHNYYAANTIYQPPRTLNAQMQHRHDSNDRQDLLFQAMQLNKMVSVTNNVNHHMQLVKLADNERERVERGLDPARQLRQQRAEIEAKNRLPGTGNDRDRPGAGRVDGRDLAKDHRWPLPKAEDVARLGSIAVGNTRPANRNDDRDRNRDADPVRNPDRANDQVRGNNNPNTRDSQKPDTTRRDTNRDGIVDGRDANNRDTNNRDINGRDANSRANDMRDRNEQNRDGQARDIAGRDANGRDANGRDANGRDANGRDANGRDANGRGSNGRDPNNRNPVNGNPLDRTPTGKDGIIRDPQNGTTGRDTPNRNPLNRDPNNRDPQKGTQDSNKPNANPNPPRNPLDNKTLLEGKTFPGVAPGSNVPGSSALPNSPGNINGAGRTQPDNRNPNNRGGQNPANDRKPTDGAGLPGRSSTPGTPGAGQNNPNVPRVTPGLNLPGGIDRKPVDRSPLDRAPNDRAPIDRNRTPRANPSQPSVAPGEPNPSTPRRGNAGVPGEIQNDLKQMRDMSQKQIQRRTETPSAPRRAPQAPNNKPENKPEKGKDKDK